MSCYKQAYSKCTFCRIWPVFSQIWSHIMVVCSPLVAHDGRVEMLQMSVSVRDVTGAATKKSPELG